MARIQVNIRFLYEGILYADTQAFIPRHEAIKIPELRVEENETRAALSKKVQPLPPKETKRAAKNNKYEDEMEEEVLEDNEEM